MNMHELINLMTSPENKYWIIGTIMENQWPVKLQTTKVSFNDDVFIKEFDSHVLNAVTFFGSETEEIIPYSNLLKIRFDRKGFDIKQSVLEQKRKEKSSLLTYGNSRTILGMVGKDVEFETLGQRMEGKYLTYAGSKYKGTVIAADLLGILVDVTDLNPAFVTYHDINSISIKREK